MMERKIGKPFPEKLVKKMRLFNITDYPTITAFLETIVETRENGDVTANKLISKFTDKCTHHGMEISRINATAGVFIKYHGSGELPTIDKDILAILKK